jgi:hypothetical protein
MWLKASTYTTWMSRVRAAFVVAILIAWLRLEQVISHPPWYTTRLEAARGGIANRRREIQTRIEPVPRATVLVGV